MNKSEKFVEKFLEIIENELKEYCSFLCSIGKISEKDLNNIVDNCLIGGMDNILDKVKYILLNKYLPKSMVRDECETWHNRKQYNDFCDGYNSCLNDIKDLLS